MLLLEAATEANTIKCEDITSDPHEGEKVNEQPELEISLHALTGWTSPKTMRLEAKIGNVVAAVLIDSGSTYNFISEKMANLLRLPVVPTETFIVHVANGEQLECQGRYEKVPVEIQGVLFPLTLYSLFITGLDLVLGIQWLEKLGSVVCNWKQLTMEFQWDNKPRKLQGSASQSIEPATHEEISKELRNGNCVHAICFQLEGESIKKEMHPDIKLLLE